MVDGSGKPYKPGQLNENGQDVTYVQDAQHEMNAFKRKGLTGLGLALAGGVTGGLLSAAGAAGSAGNIASDSESFLGAPATAVAGESTFLPEASGALSTLGGGADALAAEAGVAAGTPLTSALPIAGDVAEFGVGPGVANTGWLGGLKGAIMNPDGSVNWGKALSTFGDAANPQQGQQSDAGTLSNLAGIFTNSAGTPAWGKIAGASLGALAGLYANSKANKQASMPPLPASMTQPLIPLDFQRTVNRPTQDLRHYGESPAGEFKFFDDKLVPGHAGGGDVRGPGSGRDDKIDALLSDGEYVMDAETVAMLGDGSLDEGARRLDQMRANLRKHKGAALAKGKFSPDAKAPEAYLPSGARKAEGGEVSENPQLGVTDLPPPNSNRPAPLPNAEGTYADDVGSVLRSRLALEKLKQVIGSQITEREAQAFAKRARGGRIRPILRPARPPVASLPLPPSNLERLSTVLDKSQPLDLSKLSPEDLEKYRAWLNGILNTPPTQKAKGGDVDLRVIRGGIPKPTLEERAMKLDQIKRMIEAYSQAQDAAAQERKRLGITEGTDPYNQQPKPKLELVKARGGLVEAQARVAAIQGKIKKAEGGPVKELTEFADKLENALERGDTDLAVGE
jgi:hypothetical protein